MNASETKALHVRERAIEHSPGPFCPILAMKKPSKLLDADKPLGSRCIDRLSFETRSEPDEDTLRRISISSTPLRRKSYFGSGTKFTLHNGAEVFLFRGWKGSYCYSFEFNPNDFSGWEASVELIRLVFNFAIPPHVVTEIHFNIDLKASFKSVSVEVFPLRLRSIEEFSLWRTFKSGVPRSDRFSWSLYFGTINKKQLVVYDKSSQKKLEYPLTRIEIRYRRPAHYKTIEDVGDWLGELRPFSEVFLYRKRKKSPGKKSYKLKLHYFELLVEKLGSFKLAKQFVRKEYAKADRVSMFGEAFSCFTRRRYDLNAHFQRASKRFISMPISMKEREMFSLARKKGVSL